MNAIQQRTAAALQYMANRLREEPALAPHSVEVERLAAQVEEPCVVAVVGRVKAGKSTFINALLGDAEEWAKVGTTETTATINYFRYGVPEDRHRPVRCHWVRGGYTNVDRAFLDNLQGNDLETLRRADGISHLEYFLPTPLLKQVTLVDTPGLGAVVDEHQNRTAEFMQLRSQLRERHHRETERIGDTADAVIYVIGPVARVTDQALLEEFAHAGGGRAHALNALGVLAKVDVQPELMARREALAEKIASQLRESLNAVVPVSAGLRMALDSLLAEGGRLESLADTLRRIPPERLALMLDSEELFLDFDFDDSPVGKQERRELLGQTPWGVFTTIAREAARCRFEAGALAARLEHLAGFAALRKLLDQRFFQRGHLLRCYRTVHDVRRVLRRIRLTQLPKMEKGRRADEARLERFLRFVWASSLDVSTAIELEEFLRQHLDGGRRARGLERLVGELDELLSELFHELEEHNLDFAALQLLEDHGDAFAPAETNELRCLLGMYGAEVEKRLGDASPEAAGRRQLFWRQVEAESPRGSARASIAAAAAARYGTILSALGESRAARPSIFRGARVALKAQT